MTKIRFLVAFVGVAVILLPTAYAGTSSSPSRYSASATFTCLRHRPEAHTYSPAAPGLRYAEVRVRHGRWGGGIWAPNNPHVPTLAMTFAPFRQGSTQDRFAIADASFFTGQKAASAYFHTAYRIAQEARRGTETGLLVQQRRNVVLEWNSPFNHDYLRVVLGCLRP